MESPEARAALDAMNSATDRFADAQQFACPPWRHAAFGLCEALIILGVSTRGVMMASLYAASMLLAVALMRSDRRRTGTFVNGWRIGRTLPLSVALAVGLVGLVFWARQDFVDPFPTASGLMAATAAFVFGSLASVWWQRIYVRELRAGAGR